MKASIVISGPTAYEYWLYGSMDIKHLYKILYYGIKDNKHLYVLKFLNIIFLGCRICNIFLRISKLNQNKFNIWLNLHVYETELSF